MNRPRVEWAADSLQHFGLQHVHAHHSWGMHGGAPGPASQHGQDPGQFPVLAGQYQDAGGLRGLPQDPASGRAEGYAGLRAVLAPQH